MKTLFLIFSSAFALSALTWFFVWAIWIHAPEGWFGRAVSPMAEAARAQQPDNAAALHLVWYRRLKLTTVVLFVAATVLLLAWHFSAF